ncbi:MAG: DUF2807 domain-containing protein [Burkholderiaceae bacterium]|jgi:hypothetical protein|nr:DUF2807 domain-containing protein [Burkholderiaceae bacterium]
MRPDDMEREHPMNRMMRWLDTVLGLAFAAALVAGALTAWPGSARAAEDTAVQARGSVVTESRSVAGFEAVAVTGGIDLHISQGAQEQVQVRAQSELMPLLETVVENRDDRPTLVIRWKKGTRARVKSTPQVDVTVQRLTSVSSAGSSDIVVEPLESAALRVAIAGSGDVMLKGLTGQDLQVKIAGSGDFKAAGQVERLKIGVSGSGDVRTEDLRADDVAISIAGSGDAAVQALKTLNVSIAGAGDITYRGDPQVKTSIAGSGTVRKR